MKKILISLSFCFCFAHLSFAQTGIICKNVPGKNALQLKWFDKNYSLTQSYNLYRQEEETTAWTKINSVPIKVADANAGKDEDALYYKQYIESQQSKDEATKVFTKSFLFMRLIKSNGLAQLMAMYYRDENVVTGKTYSYELKLIDKNSEKEYAVSAPVKVEAFVKSPAPTLLVTEAGDKSVNLKWQADSSAMLYQVYRSSNSDFKNFAAVGIILNPELMPKKTEKNNSMFTDKDSTLVNGKTYFYKITALDIFGNETEMSAIASSTTVDKTAPRAVENLKAVFVKDHIHLSWKSSASKDCKGYIVYRSYSYEKDFTSINAAMLSAKDTAYDDKIISEGKKLNYYVETIDNNDNKSQSYKVVTSVPDKNPPAVPANLSAKLEPGKIMLTWDKNTESDLRGYYVFRSLKNESTNYNLLNAYAIKENFFNDTLPKEARNAFVYKICSVDSSWNRSKETEPIYVRMPDIMPPSSPVLKNIEQKENKVVISWAKVADADLKGYDVLRRTNDSRDAKKIFEKINSQLLSAKDTSYADERAEVGKNYSYSLTAFDSANNISPQSRSLSILVSSNTPVKVPANINATYDDTKKEVKLSWTAISQPQNFSGYMVFRKEGDGNYVPVSDTFSRNDFTDNTVEKNKKYSYRVNTMDKDGSMIKNAEEKTVSTTVRK